MGVGEWGGGGPDLGAVQDVVIPVRLGAHLERGEVRPRAWLGVALAPVVVAGQDAGQVEGLLFGRAVLLDAGADHAQAHRRQRRRAGARALGGEDVALHLVPARAAVFHGPARGDPALGVKDLLPGDRVLLVDEDAGDHPAGLAQLGCQGLIEKGADFIAEGQLFGRQVEIHRRGSIRLSHLIRVLGFRLDRRTSRDANGFLAPRHGGFFLPARAAQGPT